MSAESLQRKCLEAFATTFRSLPTLWARAPGRVELLGNHTDANDGLILSAAIDRDTVVLGRPIEGSSARVSSINLNKEDAFKVVDPPRSLAGEWTQYVRGVVWALGRAMGDPECGFAATIAGEVPLGAGLSSSASLQAALAFFLLGAGIIPGRSAKLDDAAAMELAGILRRSENEFVGVGSGLMDQFSAIFGRSDHALMLDCRTLAFRRVPLGPPPPAIVICDSMTSRKLADGMYNKRRAECERVVEFYRTRKGEDQVKSLRDVTLAELQADWSRLDPIGRRRARHVLTENDRVRRGVDALEEGDLVSFGRLMSASHLSSADDFENSSRALDHLIKCASSAPGYLGGKLSGAGWAGCTVNLVRRESVDAFVESVKADYARAMGLTPQIHVCRAADGASVSVT
ncbi:MAG: galactokinase [Isosphaeraceae bacterium]|nr:galactokinase [Isosphaeraceae bacterium]